MRGVPTVPKETAAELAMRATITAVRAGNPSESIKGAVKAWLAGQRKPAIRIKIIKTGVNPNMAKIASDIKLHVLVNIFLAGFCGILIQTCFVGFQGLLSPESKRQDTF